MDLFWDPNSSWSAPWVRQAAAYQQPPPQPQVSYGYYNNNYYASGDYNYAYYAYGQPPATYVPPTDLEIREELQSIRDDFRSVLKSFRTLVENLQQQKTDMVVGDASSMSHAPPNLPSQPLSPSPAGGENATLEDAPALTPHKSVAETKASHLTLNIPLSIAEMDTFPGQQIGEIVTNNNYFLVKESVLLATTKGQNKPIMKQEFLCMAKAFHRMAEAVVYQAAYNHFWCVFDPGGCIVFWFSFSILFGPSWLPP